MVLAYHAIFGAYGFWLPNDPRGSWSEFVGAWELVRFGKATKICEARSVAHVQSESGYTIYACAILPEHVHLVIGRNEERRVERMVGHLKARATQQLSATGLWPADNRPVWGENAWKVFLDSPEGIAAAVKYVEENPVKEGKPKQTWSFVVPLDV
jgi:REP element-mobilizing transposase RayT